MDETLITLGKPGGNAGGSKSGGSRPVRLRGTDPAGRKPAWLKVDLPSGPGYTRTRETVHRLGLNTVCEEARCPNIAECWDGGTATLMLLGDTCTRGCRFCNVKTGNPRGVVDSDEPARVGAAIARMDLSYVVLTTVDRDDLADGGAGHIAETVRTIKNARPTILVEALVGDFRGDAAAVRAVVDAGPDVYAHNVETVERLTRRVRDVRMTYRQSIDTLIEAKRHRAGVVTKSSIMLGLGESEEEILQTMKDLREAGVQVLTLGQYLRPTGWHLPVERYVEPQEFDDWRDAGEALGFSYVASGPLVRSSYKAGEYFIERMLRREPAPPNQGRE